MSKIKSAAAKTSIEVQPISGAIGGEIHGVDLSKPLTDELFAEIHQAFLDHLVIFFRDQDLGPEELIAIGSRFGELHIHDYTETMRAIPRLSKSSSCPRRSIIGATTGISTAHHSRAHHLDL